VKVLEEKQEGTMIENETVGKCKDNVRRGRGRRVQVSQRKAFEGDRLKPKIISKKSSRRGSDQELECPRSVLKRRRRVRRCAKVRTRSHLLSTARKNAGGRRGTEGDSARRGRLPEETAVAFAFW